MSQAAKHGADSATAGENQGHKLSGYRRERLRRERAEQMVSELLEELERLRPIVRHLVKEASRDPQARRLLAGAVGTGSIHAG